MPTQIKPFSSNGPGRLYPATMSCRWRSRQESNKRSWLFDLIIDNRTGNL